MNRQGPGEVGKTRIDKSYVYPIWSACEVEQHILSLEDDQSHDDIYRNFRHYRKGVAELVDATLYTAYVVPIIDIAMENMQMLLGSNRNHHNYPGGLLIHSYEVLFHMFTQVLGEGGRLLPPQPDRPPGVCSATEMKGQALAIIAALVFLHDWRKINCCAVYLGPKPFRQGKWEQSYLTDSRYISMYKRREMSRKPWGKYSLSYYRFEYQNMSHEFSPRQDILDFFSAESLQDQFTDELRNIKPQILDMFTGNPEAPDGFDSFRRQIMGCLRDADALSAKNFGAEHDTWVERYIVVFQLAKEKVGSLTEVGLTKCTGNVFMTSQGAATFCEIMKDELERYDLNPNPESFLDNFPPSMVNHSGLEVYGRHTNALGEKGLYIVNYEIQRLAADIFNQPINASSDGNENAEQATNSTRKITGGRSEITVNPSGELSKDQPHDFTSALDECDQSNIGDTLFSILKKVEENKLGTVHETNERILLTKVLLDTTLLEGTALSFDDLASARDYPDADWDIKETPSLGILLSESFSYKLKAHGSGWRKRFIGSDRSESEDGNE